MTSEQIFPFGKGDVIFLESEIGTAKTVALEVTALGEIAFLGKTTNGEHSYMMFPLAGAKWKRVRPKLPPATAVMFLDSNGQEIITITLSGPLWDGDKIHLDYTTEMTPP